MVIQSYREALQIARSAGEDAGNRQARKAGRRHWTAADYEHAVSVMRRVLEQLGHGMADESQPAA